MINLETWQARFQRLEVPKMSETFKIQLREALQTEAQTLAVEDTGKFRRKQETWVALLASVAALAFFSQLSGPGTTPKGTANGPLPFPPSTEAAPHAATTLAVLTATNRRVTFRGRVYIVTALASGRFNRLSAGAAPAPLAMASANGLAQSAATPGLVAFHGRLYMMTYAIPVGQLSNRGAHHLPTKSSAAPWHQAIVVALPNHILYLARFAYPTHFAYLGVEYQIVWSPYAPKLRFRVGRVGSLFLYRLNGVSPTQSLLVTDGHAPTVFAVASHHPQNP